jgi:tetratricopeptide (TPR) repeat protein
MEDGPVSPTEDREEFEEARERLVHTLLETLWDDSRGRFRDAFRRGTYHPHQSISCLLPLLWADLPQRFRTRLLVQAVSPQFFHRRHGALAWLDGEGLPDPSFVDPRQQALLLQALSAAGAADERETLAVSFLPPAAEEHLEPETLPSPGAHPAAESAVAMAARTAAAAPPGEDAELRGFAAWLARRGLSLIVAAALAAVVFLGYVLYRYLAHGRRTESVAETLVGMAHQYEQLGDYDRALRIYTEELGPLTGGLSPRHRIHRANLLLKQGRTKEAEEQYRIALQAPDPPPDAVMNLALALFHQGRLDEAKTYYRSFLEEYRLDYPELASQAVTALELIEERQTGGRVEPLIHVPGRVEVP